MTAPRITPERRISDDYLAANLDWHRQNEAWLKVHGGRFSVDTAVFLDLVDARAELAAKDAEIARLKNLYRTEQAMQKSTVKRVRHVKTGGAYRVIGKAYIQSATPLTDMDAVIIYASEKDGGMWARHEEEFGDGRFEPLPDAEIARLKADQSSYRAGLERAAEIADGVADYYETAAAVGKWDSNKATKARSERDAAKRVAYVIRDERNTRPIVEDASND